MEKNPDDAKPTPTDLPSWDEAAALEAAGGDASLARQLVMTLVQGLPSELSGLRRCFHASDWPLLVETAHRMRGATSYCGVPALDTYLRALEHTAKGGSRRHIEIELVRVEQEADRLTRALTT